MPGTGAEHDQAADALGVTVHPAAGAASAGAKALMAVSSPVADSTVTARSALRRTAARRVLMPQDVDGRPAADET